MERKRGGSWWSERGLLISFLSIFVVGVCTLCLFGCASCFKRALVFVNSRRAEGGLPPCAGIEVENSQRV